MTSIPEESENLCWREIQAFLGFFLILFNLQEHLNQLPARVLTFIPAFEKTARQGKGNTGISLGFQQTWLHTCFFLLNSFTLWQKSWCHQYKGWGERSHEIAPSWFHMLFLALSVILERLCVGDKPAAEDRGSSLNTLLQILGQAIILFYNSRQHHFLFS